MRKKQVVENRFEFSAESGLGEKIEDVRVRKDNTEATVTTEVLLDLVYLRK